jgi:ethanolamine utilization microcompartment shell protein EutS
MRRRRTAAAALVALAALSLAGCAGDPDLSTLEGDLAQVEGVNGAFVWSTHSGAPWNTQVQIMLFLDDASDDGVIRAVRGAAPVIAGDASAARHDVHVSFVDGDRASYSDRLETTADQVTVMPVVYEELGLQDSGRYSIVLRPADLSALADER